jgi:hypothetical protein
MNKCVVLLLYQSHEEANMHKKDLLDRIGYDELADLRALFELIHEVSMHLWLVRTTVGALHTLSRRWRTLYTTLRLARVSL